MRKFFALILSAALALVASSCGYAEYTESTEWIMGTLVSVKCGDTDAADKAMAAMRSVESQVNAFEEGINAAGFFPASDVVTKSVDAGEKVRQLSHGAFNIGVYDAMQAWGLVENQWQVVESKPDEKLLEQIAQNSAKFNITLKDGVYYMDGGAKITLGGVAKGAAGDIAADTLRDNGVESAIVSLGGNVVLVGDNRGKPWAVGILDPETKEPALSIMAQDTTITTAGAYERYVIIDGVKYGHILDPATAAPVDNEVLSSTILCKDGAFADALATAVFVMGQEDGLALVEQIPGAEAILMLKDYSVVRSSGAPGIEVLRGDWQEK